MKKFSNKILESNDSITKEDVIDIFQEYIDSIDSERIKVSINSEFVTISIKSEIPKFKTNRECIKSASRTWNLIEGSISMLESIWGLTLDNSTEFGRMFGISSLHPYEISLNFSRLDTIPSAESKTIRDFIPLLEKIDKEPFSGGSPICSIIDVGGKKKLEFMYYVQVGLDKNILICGEWEEPAFSEKFLKEIREFDIWRSDYFRITPQTNDKELLIKLINENPLYVQQDGLRKVKEILIGTINLDELDGDYEDFRWFINHYGIEDFIIVES